jgi:fatty-acyl-CoA synthase
MPQDTIFEVFADRAKAHPEAPAIIGQGERVSYGALHTRALRLASGLLKRELSSGSRIAYVGKSTVDYAALLLACAATNIVLVVVNWRLSPAEMNIIIANSEAELLVASEEFVSLFTEAKVTAGCDVFVTGGHNVAALPALSTVEREVAVLDHASDDEPFVQLYTSGTTGLPKGVPQTHRMHLSAYRAWTASGFGPYAVGDTVLVALPVFHTIGTNFILYALVQGATVWLLREFDPDTLRDALTSGNVQSVTLVPTVLAMISEPGFFREGEPPRLNDLIYAGSRIQPKIMERVLRVFDNARIYQVYASTETTGAGTILSNEDHRSGDHLWASAGRAMPGYEITIVDEHGDMCAASTVGEVVIRGPSVYSGYWRNAAATKEVLIEDAYHTGDAGVLDERGYLTIVDRTRDMIITGGENVYPSEVELPLSSHPAIAELSVVGLPDEKWGQLVCAFVVLRAGHALTLEDVRGHLNPVLARYKHPKRVIAIESIPKNPTGKVLRKALLEFAGGGAQ